LVEVLNTIDKIGWSYVVHVLRKELTIFFNFWILMWNWISFFLLKADKLDLIFFTKIVELLNSYTLELLNSYTLESYKTSSKTDNIKKCLYVDNSTLRKIILN